MLKRIISSVIAFPILIYILYRGGAVLKWSSFAVILLTLYEYYLSTGILNRYTLSGGVLTGLYIYIFGFQYFIVFLTLMMFVFLLASLKSKRLNIDMIGIYQISIFYIIVPIYLLNKIMLSDYPKMLWLIFLVAWGSDTCAYFIGRRFGKHKLAPSISPKKTIEGSIGGIIGATLASIGFYYYFNLTSLTDIFTYVVFIIVAVILSQLGDLVASSIKRTFKIKDFGKIMPGHGGLLDRFDSVLIIIPLFYIFLNVI